MVGKQNEISLLSQDAARLAAEQTECQRRLRELTSALSDTQRGLAMLEDERQRWSVSTARMEERLAAAESIRVQAEKFAEQSAATLLESRGTVEELRIRVSRQQEQIEEMQHSRKQEAEDLQGRGQAMQAKAPKARTAHLPQTGRQTEIPTRYRWQRDDDRYYEAILQKDLFGWVVITIWGRAGSRLGQVRTTPLAGYQDGFRLLGEISRRRAARRYYLMTQFTNAA